jgi:NTP pyrophosphatase (non-canonical NTP hydrolase)
MNNQDYAEEVKRTSGGITGYAMLDVCALGLAGEVGEIVDHIKKVLYHGYALDVEYLKKEIGDVHWYLQTLTREIGSTYDEVTDMNRDKLRKRYPDGFTHEASQARVDVQEGGE